MRGSRYVCRTNEQYGDHAWRDTLPTVRPGNLPAGGGDAVRLIGLSSPERTPRGVLALLCPNFDETLTPTGGTTYSALDGVVIRHLLRLRLTSAGSSRRLSALGSTTAKLQISQGNSLDLPAYACRIYVTAFRASIGLWRHHAVPPHPLPVRQASILSRASLMFAVHPRPPLASG